jgi:hypothetical protein
MKNFLPPPATPLVEEPMAAGGGQTLRAPETTLSDCAEPNPDPETDFILPPPRTPLVEEPIGLGGRQPFLR